MDFSGGRAGPAVPVQIDVTQRAQVEDLVAEAVTFHGGLDMLRDNAGIGSPFITEGGILT